MLLTPVTADLVTDLVLDGVTDIAEATPFAATRYPPPSRHHPEDSP